MLTVPNFHHLETSSCDLNKLTEDDEWKRIKYRR